MLLEGKVVEQGSHNELMAKNSYYANLTRIQLGVTESDESCRIETEAEELNGYGKKLNFSVLFIIFNSIIRMC